MIFLFWKRKVNWVAFKSSDQLTIEKGKIPLWPQLTAWLVSPFQGFEKYLSRVWREKYKLLKCILQLSLIPSQRNVENIRIIVFALQNVNKLLKAVLLLSQRSYHTSVSGWTEKHCCCHSQPDLPCITSHRSLVLCALEVASCAGPLLPPVLPTACPQLTMEFMAKWLCCVCRSRACW